MPGTAVPPSGLSDASLESCDQEPIHIPGSIQPHGFLLGFGGPDLRLHYASANAGGTILNRTVQRALRTTFRDLFSKSPLGDLEERLRKLQARGHMLLGQLLVPKAALQAVAHRSPRGYTILELERVSPESDDANRLENFYPTLHGAFERLASDSGADDLALWAAAEIRRLTGYDRVLIYRFTENWDGTVIAEDRNDQLPSYLGLRFPASDIPAQARRLYQVNPYRMIPDRAVRSDSDLAGRPRC